MASNPIHVLRVDDDTSNLRILSRVLRRAGFLVTTAENGLEALDLIQEFPRRFSAVVTDHNMPVMTGLELISELLKMPVRARIILSSATIHESTLALFEHREAIQVVAKPVDTNLLVAAISGTVAVPVS